MAQARALYEQVIEIEPAHFDALHFLGIIAYQASQPELAAELMGRAIDINPGHAEAHSNRGNVLRRLRQFAASLQSYDRAIELKPDYPDAYNNRGNVLRDLGQREAALLSYDRAIELRADFADAWVNRGNALRDLGRHEAALQSYDGAIALKPDYVAAHNNRGVALRDLRRYQQAVQSYDRAIALKPDYAEAHGNRANALRDLKQYDAALQSYERAIALKPDYAEAYSNRGTTLNDLNRPQAALASLDRALQIDPDYDFLYGAWLLTKMSICDWKDIAYHFAQLIEKIERNEKATSPFILLAIPCLPAQQRKAAEIWLEAKYPASNALPTIARRPTHDRIRIAYVSGDFREHPVAHLMAELFERHERTRFEPIAISLRPEAESRTGQRVRRAFAQFVDVSSKSDLEVAQLMRGLEIDIAVDLMGFTTDSRTGVFAHRPAPIQVIYLGYTGTMGMSYMDYLIADERVIPESHRSF